MILMLHLDWMKRVDMFEEDGDPCKMTLNPKEGEAR